MKSFPMPCGIPVWKNDLESVALDSLFGFIEAYVVCPTTIKRPFLPYKDKSGTLIFPTGKFIGVFYSEELKFARDLGYRVIPLRGYLYEKQSSPFEGYISHHYESRLAAKKAGDETMNFLYKLLMNSLYGRFGMNPESTVTEICNQKRYDELLRMQKFQMAEPLSDHYYIVSYTGNSFADDDEWKAPKNSAVQLSAAITACARIHMYPYISRDDCYYTDTDSVVLGSPLPDDCVSSMELGKFKLENYVKKGVFLAPKSYMLEIEDDCHIIKHKGPAKDLVTSEWFQNQLADPSLTENFQTISNFSIDWKKLLITKKERRITLGLPKSTKRENVYDENNGWIDTRPIDVIDLGNQDSNTIFKYELWKIKAEELAKEKAKYTTHTQGKGKSTTHTQAQEGQKTTTTQPTLYTNKPKKKKKTKQEEILDKPQNERKGETDKPKQESDQTQNKPKQEEDQTKTLGKPKTKKDHDKSDYPRPKPDD